MPGTHITHNNQKYLYFTYDEYHELVLELERKIVQTGWRPNQIICIVRGATFGATILSEVWGCAVAYIAMKTRGKKDEQMRNEDVFFERQMINNSAGFGRQAILLDDLTDTGLTTETSTQWLDHDWKYIFKRLRTAMVFHKTGSLFTPDFHALEIPKDEEGKHPWIIQPWDVKKIKEISGGMESLNQIIENQKKEVSG